jgi:hypothetical protein
MAPINPDQDNMELLINDISQRIESLKVQFNLFFSGELRVPPEKERVALEKKIRNLMYTGNKGARINLLVQNVSSKFSLYNNMWLKRLNEIESGMSILQRKKVALMDDSPPKPPKKKVKGKSTAVSLNNEDSFDKLFDNYSKLVAKDAKKPPDKDKMINSIKSKMISANVIDAKVDLAIVKGKLKIKIKSQH